MGLERINDRTEILILTHLIYDEPYTRKVIPHLKKEYFTDRTEAKIFETIQGFLSKYNSLPTKEAILIICGEDSSLGQDEYDAVAEYLSNLEYSKSNKPDLNWLVDETEVWCRDQAIFNAYQKSITITDECKKSKGRLSLTQIPSIMAEAIGINFNSNIGHDYLEDAQSRFAYYVDPVKRIPFDIHYLNEITGGGLKPKTLNVLAAGTGVGKTLVMCHMAAANLLAGYDVLYITLEVSQEEIGERIDANLLDIPIGNLRNCGEDYLMRRMGKLRSKPLGRLIVREYPTATANTAHFRALLDELKVKKGFAPAIIYVDYLNIATSVRYTKNTSAYDAGKYVAEELRGMAAEYCIPVVTATQFNRSGNRSSDVNMTDTAESFGVPMTADLMLGLMTSEEYDELGLIKFKQLKSRYAKIDKLRVFLVGVDKSKMRLFDAPEEEQKRVRKTDTEEKKGESEKDTPVFDNGNFGQGMGAEKKKKRSFDDMI